MRGGKALFVAAEGSAIIGSGALPKGCCVRLAARRGGDNADPRPAEQAARGQVSRLVSWKTKMPIRAPVLAFLALCLLVGAWAAPLRAAPGERLTGYGDLRFGMTVAEAAAAIGEPAPVAPADGTELIETKVGDRYVLEAMLEHKALLGGEQSGHIIFLDKGHTGDGLLTAVRLLDVLAGTGKELRQLRAEAITEYPQILQNVPVRRGASLDDAAAVWEEVRAVESELGDEGRVLIRPSGTEPLIRVMVEAPSEEAARRYAERLSGVTQSSMGKEG